MAASAIVSKEVHPFELFVVLRAVDTAVKYRHTVPLAAHVVSRRYPHLVRFCFPFTGDQNAGASEQGSSQYVFVLTNDQGHRLYGFCTRSIWGEVFCFLSKHCWPGFFYNLTAEFIAQGEDTQWIRALQLSSTPEPGHAFLLSSSKISELLAQSSSALTSTKTSYDLKSLAASVEKMPSGNTSRVGSFVKPSREPVDLACASLPMIYRPEAAAENAHPSYLLEYLRSVDLSRALAAILCEQRIIVVGASLEIVSRCIFAMLALIRPFVWPHVLVPVVPRSLIDVLSAPTPYIVGLTYAQVPPIGLRELDADGLVVVRLGVTHGRCSAVEFVNPGESLAQHVRFAQPPASGGDNAAAPGGADAEKPRPEEQRPADVSLDVPHTGFFSALSVQLRTARSYRARGNSVEGDRIISAAYARLWATIFGPVIAVDDGSRRDLAVSLGPFAKYVSETILFEIARKEQAAKLQEDEQEARAELRYPVPFGATSVVGRMDDNSDFRLIIAASLPLAFPHLTKLMEEQRERAAAAAASSSASAAPQRPASSPTLTPYHDPASSFSPPRRRNTSIHPAVASNGMCADGSLADAALGWFKSKVSCLGV